MALTKEYKNRINELFMEFYDTRDTEKFGELYVALRPYLYNLIRLKFNNKHDAIEAIMSTAFMNMFERISTFNPKYKPWNWIQTIVVNNSIAYFYNARMDWNIYQLETVYDLQMPENENYEYLYVAIDRLNEDDRIVIDLILAGYTSREIAIKLGVEHRTDYYGIKARALRNLFYILNTEAKEPIPDKYIPQAKRGTPEHRAAIKEGMRKQKELGIRRRSYGSKYGPRKK